MKTAISVPNDVFVVADKFAKDRGMSRSELYATAIREYLRRHRRDGLTERINASLRAWRSGPRRGGRS